MLFLFAALLSAAFALSSNQADARLIASWDFNDGDLIVDQGAGTMTVNLTGSLTQTFAGGTAINAQPGVDAGLAFAMQSDAATSTYDIRFAFDMTGYRDVTVDWAWRGDPSWRTGIDGTQTTISWSGDGGASFLPRFQTVPPAAYTELFDFGFIPVGGENNNANVVMRLSQGPSNIVPGEQFLLDNVTITAIPEPGSCLVLAAFAATMFVSRRRRRR